MDTDRLLDSELLAALRSDNADDRNQAINQLFPEGSAVLLRARDSGNVDMTLTKEMNAGAVFTGLLFLAQRFGQHLGLALAWVPDPEQQSQIQVARPQDVLR